jgi:hypothetical protein
MLHRSNPQNGLRRAVRCLGELESNETREYARYATS